MNMNVHDGFIDGSTLPAGSQIDQKIGTEVPSMNLVSAIQVHIHEVGTTGGKNGVQMVLIPSPPSDNQYPVPSILNNNPSKSVQSFGRTRSRTRPAPSDTSVASLAIDGRAYYGPEFDSHGNHFNLIVKQMEFASLVLVWSILNFICLSIL